MSGQGQKADMATTPRDVRFATKSRYSLQPSGAPQSNHGTSPNFPKSRDANVVSANNGCLILAGHRCTANSTPPPSAARGFLLKAFPATSASDQTHGEDIYEKREEETRLDVSAGSRTQIVR
jgi:hypothetical protein